MTIISLTPEQEKERIERKQKQFMGGLRQVEAETGMEAVPVLRYMQDGIFPMIFIREKVKKEEEKI